MSIDIDYGADALAGPVLDRIARLAAQQVIAQGTVTVQRAAFGQPFSDATVEGVVDRPMWVPRAQWSTPFAQQVDQLGLALTGRLVEVHFIGGVPHIAHTYGG